jgi:hypothetical protein
MNSLKDGKVNVRLKSRGGTLSVPLPREVLEHGKSCHQQLKSAGEISRTNKKPTKSVGIFDLIEAQLKAPKKKVSNSVLSNHPSQNEKKQSITMIEKVKVMKMSDQPMNEFIVVRKPQKKKLSTVKKRILLVSLFRYFL